MSMENYSPSNSNEPFEPLSLGAVAAFTPFVFLKLVIALTSNAILLTLVILSSIHKFNNSINIYLFLTGKIRVQVWNFDGYQQDAGM